jgi:hypothetical protein
MKKAHLKELYGSFKELRQQPIPVFFKLKMFASARIM